MRRFAVVATAGAGGDLPPLIAVAKGLGDRGHDVRCFGDMSVANALRGVGGEADLLPSELDLGPRLEAAQREAAAASPEEGAGIFRTAVAKWSIELWPVVSEMLERTRPDVVVTSLFGAAVAAEAANAGRRSCVVNSTFYVGPNPPRPLDADFAPRAAVFIEQFHPHLDRATLVLHATDQEFDYGFHALPPHHHYVGPLVWDLPVTTPLYLEQDGDPWVLVTISSQAQDDVRIAEEALAALSDRPVRVVATVGPGHQPAEVKISPPNARIERFVPHGKVLERARLFVGHAGHGSVMKALWFGVPMVLVPWGRDQPGVAARAERLGVARVVPPDQLTAAALTNAIGSVLDNRAFRERAQAVSQRLQRTDPVAAACGHVERLAG